MTARKGARKRAREQATVQNKDRERREIEREEGVGVWNREACTESAYTIRRRGKREKDTHRQRLNGLVALDVFVQVRGRVYTRACTRAITRP